MQDHSLKVFYDGLCVLCSSEINHYRKMKGAENIKFVDITGLDFDAKNEGLDPFLVHKELHAKDENGRVFVGVETFILIWSKLDKLKWVSRLAQKSLVKKTLQLNYKAFVKIRPYLPRKSCEDSPYCETRATK